MASRERDRFNFQVDPDDVAFLDALLALRQGTNRSELLRTAMRMGLTALAAGWPGSMTTLPPLDPGTLSKPKKR